ncbi:MAG TPA: endopeptidase La [Casimicrobiaceae bacterium]|jgi:ATP-dependent Lon protease|nr:endopeptidase La [Casimicrobiaceae bacterium]
MNEETKSNTDPVTADAGTRVDGTPTEGQRQRETTSRPLPEDALIIVPVRNVVLFPGMVFPLTVGRERSRAAAQEATRLQRPLGILLQSKPEVEEPGPDDLHWVGTTANVLRYITAPDGSHHAICKGAKRFRVLQFLEGYPFTVARVQIIEDPEAVDADIEGRAHSLKERAIEILQLLPQVPEEMVAALQGVEGSARLADFIAGLMDISPEEKQALLETFDLKARLDKLLELLSHRIEVLKVSREVDERTRQSIDDSNRKHLLREQMRTIQKELGEGDESATEIAELEKAITEARMPEEVEKHARKELKRLERMPEAAGEYSMIRTYLEWLIELPWAPDPEAPIDIAEARRILDADHYGLEKVKRRILEFLAVRKLNPSGKSPILCFVGPPGVGKTSLGQSIARATGRKFVRVSLGGVHDEAEIRGHRRTYIGSLPGNIIQNLRKAGTRNCVMMLDEVDKLGMGGFHGDPASALLEVLDPEQNSTFRDNYLAVPFDLSGVMFICTANVLDTIPGPLRDRMEIIQLPGYTAQEKLQIARRYLVPRQLAATGLTAEQCEISDSALLAIIDDYTREAGVRNLEREIGNVFRNVAVRIAEGSAQQVKIGPDELPAILGPRKFEAEVAMRSGVPGVATGLAWTPVGGDILFVEAARMPGTGKLILTGQLGEVMKESAQAALSLIKARARELGVPPEGLEKSDIHIHVPAGATPKDGPSAGVAIFVALASLMTGRPVRSDVAMTGEISLRGLVLSIGGVKEKVLAALRAGISTVMLPARNRRDLEEIPADARDKLKFVWIEQVDEAIATALSPAPAAAPPA